MPFVWPQQFQGDHNRAMWEALSKSWNFCHFFLRCDTWFQVSFRETDQCSLIGSPVNDSVPTTISLGSMHNYETSLVIEWLAGVTSSFGVVYINSLCQTHDF